MLRRSTSTLILNPWKPYFKGSSPVHQFPKSRVLTPSSKLLPAPSMIGGLGIKMMGALSAVVGKRIPRMAVLDGGLCCGVDGVGGCFGSWDGDTEEDMAETLVDDGEEAGTDSSGGNPFSPPPLTGDS